MRLMTTVSAAALITVAAPAFAELDAATVWQEMQASFPPFLSVTAAQTVATDQDVRLTDVVIRMTEGRDEAELRLPGFSIVETADGGIIAQFEGNGQFEAMPDDGTVRGNRVAADVTMDGLALTVSDVGGWTFELSGPALGVVVTDLTIDGVRETFEGSFSVNDLSARLFDSGEGGPQRQVEVALAGQGLSARTMMRDIEGIERFDLIFDLADIDIAGMLDAPGSLFQGRPVRDGTGQSMLEIDLGAMAMAFGFREEPYDPGYASEIDISVGFDGLTLSHAAQAPLTEALYFDGRDLIPDDAQGHLEYAVQNMRGTLALVENTNFFSPREMVANAELVPSSASVRIDLNEAGLLTYAVQAVTSWSMDVVEARGDVGDRRSEAVTLAMRDLTYEVEFAVPLDNIMQVAMQGLPPGLLYRVSAALGGADMMYSETRDDGFGPVTDIFFDGTTESASVAAELTDQGLSYDLSLARAAGVFEEGGTGQFEGEMLEFATSLQMPLNTGVGSAPYVARFGIGSLVLDDPIWDMVDPGGQLDRGPMSIQAEAEGQMRAVLNPAALMGFGLGMSPVVVETINFDMVAAALGVSMTAIGAFDTEDLTVRGTPPIGQADLAATGLDQVLDVVISMGLLSPDEVNEIQFMLGAFTVQEADGSRSLRVEINEQEHLIVNGQRMQ